MSLPRHLLLLFAIIGMATAMGFFREQSSDEMHEETGDWPDEFPTAPEGFQFRCKCPKGCRPKTKTTTVAPSSASSVGTPPILTQFEGDNDKNEKSNLVFNGGELEGVDVSGEDLVSTTQKAIPSSSAAPNTTAAASAPAKPTTTASSSVKPTTTSTVKPTTHGGSSSAPNTATTFWIRTPTPPNRPFPVDANSGGLNFGTPKILSPFAPEQALKPLDANLPDSNGFDFNIATVGTPKAPRAVIDPDA